MGFYRNGIGFCVPCILYNVSIPFFTLLDMVGERTYFQVYFAFCSLNEFEKDLNLRLQMDLCIKFCLMQQKWRTVPNYPFLF